MYFDFNLPKDSISEQFALYNSEEKQKIIELGLSLYKSGSNKLYTMNNEEWKQKINGFEEKLRRENEKYEKLQKEHKQEMEQLANQIRSSCEVSYQNESELLKKSIVSLQNQLQEQNNMLFSIRSETQKEVETKYETKLEQEKQNIQKERENTEKQREKYEEKLEKQREKYEEKLEKEREKTSETKKRKNNSTLKGQDGEASLEKLLNRLFPKAEIVNYTSKEGGRGDFSVLLDDINMMVEAKNYEKNVPKGEITKFYKDMKNNQEYTCGILLSLQSGICRKQDFSFEFVDGRPVMFLHNANNDVNKLTYAVSFFKIIMSITNLDINNQEILDAIIEKQGNVTKAYNTMKSMINKFHEDVLQLLETHQSELNTLFQLILRKNTSV
jgi:hypothetical protein